MNQMRHAPEIQKQQTIRSGAAGDILNLKALWKLCFADEDAYIDAFFEMLYEDSNVLLAEENGVLMGASFFLPGKLYQSTDGWQDIRYVYALATYPEYRGRGIAGRLLHYAYEYYHAPLIAEPAEEGLVGGFYEPLGFHKAFYLSRLQAELPRKNIQAADAGGGRSFQASETTERGNLQAAELAGWGNTGAAEMRGEESPHRAECENNRWKQWKIEEADGETYRAVRDLLFRREGYVRWPLRHTAFAIREHQTCGGGALLLTHAHRKNILLYYKEEGRIVVTETTLTKEEVLDFFAAWFPNPGEELVIQSAGKAGNGKLAGMVYGSSVSGGYLNLTLD